MRPRVATLTDAGPGVGVSNFEVKFRDAELARLWHSDYRIRLQRSRGDSGQGEAERTISAIGDSVVDGATIDWEIVKRYEGMTAEEVEGMSLQAFEKYEAERMLKNAWAVSKELVKRIDGAPVFDEYINCKLSKGTKCSSSIRKAWMPTNMQVEGKRFGCEYCSEHNWIGPSMKRLPQPIKDTENSGHFLNVFKTPRQDRVPDDWQPKTNDEK
eukprot:gene903-206_t